MKLIEKKIRTLKHVPAKAVGFRIDRVRLPNGKMANREYLVHPGAVAAIPVLPDGRIVLVKQYRYPVGQATIELPAGKLEKGGGLLQTLKNELEEETGYRAEKIEKILSFWPTAAFANEIIHIYVARNLKKEKPHPDDDEFVETVAWPIEKIVKAIRSGKIKDSKTIIGILAYLRYFGGGGGNGG